MGAVLYVVVPSENIENVWPGRLGEIDEVRFGTATKGDQAITQAVAVHKGLATLYLCLSPNGVLIDDIGALGI
ncbi:hypothetical protein KJ866_01355 [Patescibacteria group bacterium]|nr:hypothetical protein [Patescibacteria group bacterium]MBU2220221.1 hypothetical protein [Patescibacteria group bacterium]MBU2265052.1 hypothetical protein [Patescibacteria group bacterium]